ncbi:hypothetical protein [Aquitalea aquatica]|uniref:Lipoprotein n=1 Tax=Aquitalea aquatica TaxID=3044273 RepID=A0A838Y4I6_9NEIS|nr:hypothetical protein [Aquitalea magnusonii]MBA4710350.1 hypothetical protein [Aquitalea magnusonii]
MNKTVISLLLGTLLSACASHPPALPDGPAGPIRRETGQADCPDCSKIVTYRAERSFGAEQHAGDARFKGTLSARTSLLASNHTASGDYAYRLVLDINASGNYLAVTPLVARNQPLAQVQQQDAEQLHVWWQDAAGRRRMLLLSAYSRSLPLQDFQCRVTPGDGYCSWKQYVELPAAAVEEAIRLHAPLRLFVGSTHSNTVYGMRSYNNKPSASVVTQYKGASVELPAQHVLGFSQAMHLLDIEINQ